MTVRRATREDVARLTRLAQLEHARSQFNTDRFDPAVAARNFETCATGALSAVFISNTAPGFIAGFVQPGLYNGRMTAHELAWYSEDGSGLALLDAFTVWAQRMRATRVVVANFAGIKDAPKFTRVLNRKGFAFLGNTFSKSLNQ